MPSGSIQVRAIVRLLPTKQGGRVGPVAGRWRPNHNFFGADNREMATGLMEVPEAHPLVPGDERLLDILFVAWPKGVEFVAGNEWRIQEGAQLVGWGKIVNVG
jgi:translation elongation factor EF-Tu-like GTPase